MIEAAKYEAAAIILEAKRGQGGVTDDSTITATTTTSMPVGRRHRVTQSLKRPVKRASCLLLGGGSLLKKLRKPASVNRDDFEMLGVA